MYDLAEGRAREAGETVLGRQLEGVWHSGLVCYGREYYFTRAGVASVLPVLSCTHITSSYSYQILLKALT